MSRIYLARNVLDHQLLDGDGRRCGKVDDLAIEGGAGESAVVVAILAGPGVWPQRSGRLGRLAGWLGGSKRISVPWAEVKCVSSAVELRRPATHYGLAKVEDRLRPFVEKIPGADR
jgi:sporulation protein YlmC with PRC-barrel domain